MASVSPVVPPLAAPVAQRDRNEQKHDDEEDREVHGRHPLELSALVEAQGDSGGNAEKDCRERKHPDDARRNAGRRRDDAQRPGDGLRRDRARQR